MISSRKDSFSMFNLFMFILYFFFFFLLKKCSRLKKIKNCQEVWIQREIYFCKTSIRVTIRGVFLTISFGVGWALYYWSCFLFVTDKCCLPAPTNNSMLKDMREKDAQLVLFQLLVQGLSFSFNTWLNKK